MNKHPQLNQIKEAAQSFLTAFDALDWEPFQQCFAPDATIFMPFPDVVRRLDGWEAIAPVFQPFFVKVRAERSGPPYLNLQPLDLAVQGVDDMAVVTFHLQDAGVVSRRTAVFQRRNGRWLIVHLHASNMVIEAI